MYKGTKVITLENVFDGTIMIKYRNKIYKTKKIEGHFQDPEKKKQAIINNQKELALALKERDERQKARNCICQLKSGPPSRLKSGPLFDRDIH